MERGGRVRGMLPVLTYAYFQYDDINALLEEYPQSEEGHEAEVAGDTNPISGGIPEPIVAPPEKYVKHLRIDHGPVTEEAAWHLHHPLCSITLVIPMQYRIIEAGAHPLIRIRSRTSISCGDVKSPVL